MKVLDREKHDSFTAKQPFTFYIFKNTVYVRMLLWRSDLFTLSQQFIVTLTRRLSYDMTLWLAHYTSIDKKIIVIKISGMV